MKCCFTIITFFLISCTQPNKNHSSDAELIVRPLYPYVETVNQNNGYKVRLYSVENFRSYNEDSTTLDRFIVDHIDQDYKDHFNYSIQFFEKKSALLKKITRKEQIPGFDYENPVIAYNWSRGVFRGINYSKSDLFWVYHKNKPGIFKSLDTIPSRDPEKLAGE